MTDKPKAVAVVGATGFLGGELVRLLAHHPLAQLKMVCGHRSAGRPLGDARPSLLATGLDVMPIDADAIANAAELALLALPHGESALLAAQLLDRGVKVIDLGSDFRLREAADYPRYYGREHPRPELLSRAVYSMPELTGPLDPTQQLVANPGCFATALALAAVPLVPLLAPQARIAAVGITGSSGSGAAPSKAVHHSLRPTNLTAYKPLTHQHLGELLQLMRELHGREVALDFVPHSGPFVRGIHVTLQLRRAELSDDVLARYREQYAKAKLVSVSEGPVAMGSVVGSCRAALGVSVGDEVVVVYSAIDNLIKGGSGQALHNMNLLMGWPELAGLPQMGMWP
jgi:N-acetyl-gamma-glutamyl-phosphate/LysW-gamma-L-alpha-aminoadipyl-6-phosphate reductase